MFWRLVLVGLVAASVQAFAPVSIRWVGRSDRNFILAPRTSPSTAPELLLWEKLGRARFEQIPLLSPQPDGTITWEQERSEQFHWCIEASGKQNAIHLSRCTAEATQLWDLLPPGRRRTSQIRLKGTKTCIGVNAEGSEDGAPLELRRCEDEATQMWRFDDPLQLPAQGSASPSSVHHVVASSLFAVALAALSVGSWLWRRRQTARVPPLSAYQGGVCLSPASVTGRDKMLLTPASYMHKQNTVPAVLALNPMETPGSHSGDPKTTSVQSAVFVTVEIKPDRVDDFITAMEDDVTKSRVVDYDPGCCRFDLLRNRDDPNKFIFYEAYKDDEANAFHKTTSHYNSWADFKKSGGVVSQEVAKVETATIPGDWAFQTLELGRAPVGSAVLVTVEIQPERVDDFIKAMADDVQNSRRKDLDPGCMRFDLLRDREDPNKFYFYEAYINDDAAAFHKTTSHYNSWAEFKKDGGVVSQSVVKLETTSIPGDWAFQCYPPGSPMVAVGSTLMPLIGFGTYKVGAVPASASSVTDGSPPPPAGPEVCGKIVKDALSCGYGMLDCGQFYMNEAWTGSAVSNASVPRENLYIISKVWNDVIFKGADAVKEQVDSAIADLKCGYIDLFLVHWPVPGKHVEAFKALCECKVAGKIKEVGVSNYCIEDTEELKAAGCDKPAMNQIEVNPLLFRKKTLDYFKQEGVHVQAYRGLMQGPVSWENPVIQEVCAETGKTPSQVLGRFLVQQGISHVPKASTPDRMKENRDIFSFELSPEQMERLSNLTCDDALEAFKNLYIKCIWRDTPQEGSPWTSERTLN